MDAIRFSLLAVFLSTSAELKIHDAADSYQMIQSQCLPHIATWWTVFQFEYYHKTSRWPVLCNPVTVCRRDTFSSTGVAYSYPANTDSNSPAFHDIYDPQSASDTSDVTRGLRVLREQLFLRLLLTTCRASVYTLDLESCLGTLRQS
jgi:hypothetical protein